MVLFVVKIMSEYVTAPSGRSKSVDIEIWLCSEMWCNIPITKNLKYQKQAWNCPIGSPLKAQKCTRWRGFSIIR